jgi:putative oxidoreductase
MEPFDTATLILRVVLGIVMLAHGVKHARGKAKTSRWFGSIGFKKPALQWFASSVTEIGVGVMLIVGLGTTFAVAGTVGVMTVAFWSVHRMAGFWVTARPDEGYEFVLVLGTSAVVLAMLGPGAISVDNAIGLDVLLDGWIGLAAGAVGIAGAAAQLATFYRPDRIKEPNT